MEFGLVALWLVVLFSLAGLAFPVAAWLAPDCDAAALAFPLALAVLGVVGHLVGQIAFGWPAALAGLVVLAGLSSVAARRREGPLDRWRFLEAGAVFTVAFLLVVCIRALDPAAAPLPLAIGEKFLDFSLLRSLERAPALPPEDAWFAGEHVRYYYGGHLLTTLLGTLTDTGARFAYNLGLATFYATLVTAAYGLAGSIATPYDVSRRLAAGLGAFFVGIASNLETAARITVWLLPDGVAGSLVDLLGLGPETAGWTPAQFWYFGASRIIPVDPTAQEPFPAATEFPLFSWLNGDLHAHMMSQPFTLLVGALLVAYWRVTEPSRSRLLVFGALPPVVGFLGVANVWSFPTAIGLVVLAVLFAPADPAELLPEAGQLRARLAPSEGRILDEGRRLGLAVAVAVVVAVLAVLWTAPFWFGVIPGGPGKSVALWGRWTPAGPLLLVLGGFLAVFAPYLARPIGAEIGSTLPAWIGGVALLVGSILLGVPALGIVIGLVAGGWWLLQDRDDAGFELVLVIAGAAVVLVVELLTVEGERFNVIFKAYSQVWLFWAVASGVVLARLTEGWPAGLSVDRRRLRAGGIALAALLVVSTSLYAGLALTSHVQDASPTAEAGGPTLDATAYLESEYAQEAAAIRWLDAREGRPTIVTAAPGGYRWEPENGEGSSAPASLTGLPTVLGWHHERQYRGTEPYDRRLDHVERIYEGPTDRQRELLARYDVQYVYVGPAERAAYGEITVDDLGAVSVEKQYEAVTIYAVDQSVL